MPILDSRLDVEATPCRPPKATNRSSDGHQGVKAIVRSLSTLKANSAEPHNP